MITLGAGVALTVLAAGMLTVAGALVARYRAGNAADSGALAGALFAFDGEVAACAAAGRLVGENGAWLVACAVAGPIVTVSVDVRTSSGLTVHATARAGPVMAG
ncbi:Rv3654c family TadE-like protein [Dactylosporangium sp. CA-092794]|uniref:Rv3654c family TadE-like protein n=1 Tax=Dactylosporangium sp. CA-092794 TaxID=3239929 RepID=UPI003D94954E